MDGNTYQRLAARTLLEKPDVMPTAVEFSLIYNALKQAVDKGSTAELLKKQICHRHGLQFENAVSWLGDSLLVPERMPTEDEYMVFWNLLGLVGEVAEFIGIILEQFEFGLVIDQQKAIKELGDIDWYKAAICTKLGISMNDVFEHNIQKLKARFPDGYTSERTTFREGVAE